MPEGNKYLGPPANGKHNAAAGLAPRSLPPTHPPPAALPPLYLYVRYIPLLKIRFLRPVGLILQRFTFARAARRITSLFTKLLGNSKKLLRKWGKNG
jgi:hypothetical protein